jgi:peptide deformylase
MINAMENRAHTLGGAGIACNQVAEIDAPVAILLIGTNDPATRDAIAQRYPGEIIPSSTLLINPRIVARSEESYFPTFGEGCLSVAGPMRGKVRRHRTVRVSYQDQAGGLHEMDYGGFAAHVIQHEYDHLRGTVFMQKIFADCSEDQRRLIAMHVELEQQRRRQLNPEDATQAATEPVLVFNRKGDAVDFSPERLSLALRGTPDETLAGLQTLLDGAYH